MLPTSLIVLEERKRKDEIRTKLHLNANRTPRNFVYLAMAPSSVRFVFKKSQKHMEKLNGFHVLRSK